MTVVAVPLEVVSTVTLDANGDGTIRLSPAGEKWEVTSTYVECSDTTSEAVCKVFRRNGFPLGGTYSGSSGDANDTRYYLEDGHAVTIEWTGGTPGATATVTLTGWRSAPDGGFRAVH